MTRPDTALARALDAHLPADIGLGMADPAAPPTGLWPEEALPKAVEKRLCEFAAGRRAARQAMSAIGIPPAAIPAGQDRAPVWPDGVLGSISHGGGACLALVAKKHTSWALLGIDIEADTSLEPELWETVLTPEERASLPEGPAAGLQAKRIFSAKEATYKAQYPLSSTLLEFHDLAVGLERDAFTARFARPAGPLRQGTVLRGICLAACGLILTALWARADEISGSVPEPPA
jgi:4'-phosphopantetheinyl transferase EntD